MAAGPFLRNRAKKSVHGFESRRLSRDSHRHFIPAYPLSGVQTGPEPQSTWHDDCDLKAEAISSLGLERTMGEVIRFVPKSELERVRLIREARAIYDGIFPSTDSASEQRDDIKQLIASGRVV